MAKMFKAVRISKGGGIVTMEFPEDIAMNKKVMAAGGWQIQGEIPETLEELKENTARKVEVEEITPTIKKITKSKTGK